MPFLSVGGEKIEIAQAYLVLKGNKFAYGVQYREIFSCKLESSNLI